MVTQLTESEPALNDCMVTPGDAANETPKPGATELDRSRFVLVARPQASLEAAARLAATLGYRPVISVEEGLRQMASGAVARP